MKLFFGVGGNDFGFLLKKINFSLGKAIETHAHKEFIDSMVKCNLKKINHLTFQINGVFDFSYCVVRVSFRIININLGYNSTVISVKL